MTFEGAGGEVGNSTILGTSPGTPGFQGHRPVGGNAPVQGALTHYTSIAYTCARIRKLTPSAGRRRLETGGGW